MKQLTTWKGGAAYTANELGMDPIQAQNPLSQLLGGWAAGNPSSSFGPPEAYSPTPLKAAPFSPAGGPQGLGGVTYAGYPAQAQAAPFSQLGGPQGLGGIVHQTQGQNPIAQLLAALTGGAQGGGATAGGGFGTQQQTSQQQTNPMAMLLSMLGGFGI